MGSVPQSSASPQSAPTFNRTHVGQALRNLRIRYRDDDSRRDALNRAALDLEAQQWSWQHGILTIESITQIGNKVKYEVRAGVCNCQAGITLKPCRHAAAWELLFTAEQLARPRKTFEELTNACDELF